MGIVGGLDIHRRQITFDYLDTGTAEVSRGKIAPADRQQVRSWLEPFEGRGDVAFALEAGTGWRFVVEELLRVGARAHLAETADTAHERGRKQRAKTDRTDARLLRELLAVGRLPESWIAPDDVLEVRARVRLYKALADERRGWMQRIRATLFHQGVPALACHLLDPDGQAHLERADLSPSGRESVEVALGQIDRLDTELSRLRGDRRPSATTRSGAGPSRATTGSAVSSRSPFGRNSVTAGAFTPPPTPCATPVWTSRCGRQTPKRAPGHLARQGPAILRWALYEAATSAARRSSPDHDYYLRGLRPPGAQPGRPGGRSEAEPALLPHASGAGGRRPGAGRLISLFPPVWPSRLSSMLLPAPALLLPPGLWSRPAR